LPVVDAEGPFEKSGVAEPTEDGVARFVAGAFPVQVTANTVNNMDRITAPIIARDFNKPPPQPSDAGLKFINGIFKSPRGVCLSLASKPSNP